jgi:nitronate monooxygenase
MLTQAFTGIDANMLRPSVVAAGLDPKQLAGPVQPEKVKELLDSKAEQPRRWVDIWSAGHTVSGIDAIKSVADLIDEIATEYDHARRDQLKTLKAEFEGERNPSVR